MKTIQETFDVTIRAGYYPYTNQPTSSSNMCISLRFAFRSGLITDKERIKAVDSIARYLGTRSHTLREALRISGYGDDPKCKFRKEIYQCWAGRPPLKRIRKS